MLHRRLRVPRDSWPTVAVGAVAPIVVGLVVWRVADGGDNATSSSSADPGPVHVHALGVNPADDALFIATHTGLYRVEKGDEKASRVSDRHQDTMGFTVSARTDSSAQAIPTSETTFRRTSA